MKSEIFITKEQRDDIAENHSKEYGEVVKTRIADITYLATEIQKERRKNNQSMVISLEPVRENRFKEPNYNLKFAKDVENNIFYGIVIGVYPDDNIHWRGLQINEYITLNLDNIEDAKVWAVLRVHPDTEGSPFQRTDPIFRVHDPEVIAIKKISEGKEMIKAMNRATLLEGEALVAFARSLGIMVSPTTSLNELRGAAMGFAQEHFKDFNEKWDDGDRNLKEIFASAVAVRIIKLDPQRGYNFGSIPLGMNLPSAIAFLKNDAQLLTTITGELSSKDSDLKRLVLDEEKEVKDVKPKGKSDKVV